MAVAVRQFQCGASSGLHTTHQASYNGSHFFDLCDITLTRFAGQGRFSDSDGCWLPASPPPLALSALPSPPPLPPGSRFMSIFAAPDPDRDRREVYLLLDHLYRGGGADTFLGGSMRSGPRWRSAEVDARCRQIGQSISLPLMSLEAVSTASLSASDTSR